MDEFFDGLDCRLRVSGMVADSIMMGIVNSAMETAFEKSCSKEGDLERLNEKSRFCELAIVQLEWCLKYVQEEMDSYIVESCREREKLLSELLKTRDRLHNRLQETELVIAQMDIELVKMKSNDLRLRLALQMKDDELRSLQAALDLERAIKVRGHSFHPCHSNYTSKDISQFDELRQLRTSTERHVQRITGKLKDGQQHLTDLLRKLSLSLSDVEKPSYSFNVREKGIPSDAFKLLLQENGVVDLESAMPEHCHRRLMRTLNIELEEIAVDINILNEKLEHSFEMMGRSMSLLKTTLDEQQLEYHIEKEAFEVIIRNFVLDLHCGPGKNAATKNLAAVIPDESWSAFMEEIKMLHKELELLINLKDTKAKVHSGFDVKLSPYPTSVMCTGIKDKSDCQEMLRGNSCGLPKPADDSDCVADGNGTLDDVFTLAPKLVSEENLSKENNSGQSVAAIVRSHERIIRQKSEELKWLKVELNREKVTSTHKDKDLDSVQKLISSVISRLEIIMKENVKPVATSAVCMWGYGGEINSIQDNNISQSESLEKETKITETMSEIPVELESLVCCHLSSGVCRDDVRNIKQEKNDWDFEVMILEEMYAILFAGLLNGLHLEFFNCDSETFIREDTQRTIFKEIIKECSLWKETYGVERLVSDAVDCIVLSEIVKDIKCTIRSTFRNFHGEVIPCGDYRPDGLIIHDKKVEPSPEFVFLSKNFKAPEECLELIEFPISNSSVVCEDNALSQINKELRRGVQKKVHGNRQLPELSSSAGLLDNRQGIHDQVTSTGAFGRKNFFQFKPEVFGATMSEELQSSLPAFIKLSQLMTDFELIASEKIRINISRLVDLSCQLNCFFDELMSIKRKELLYKTAFTRRCYDLQIAEVEVDLLGDEVELLVGLLEKIYVALDHYSPVLQNYFGIMDVIRLIHDALSGEIVCTSL